METDRICKPAKTGGAGRKTGCGSYHYIIAYAVIPGNKPPVFFKSGTV